MAPSVDRLPWIVPSACPEKLSAIFMLATWLWPSRPVISPAGAADCGVTIAESEGKHELTDFFRAITSGLRSVRRTADRSGKSPATAAIGWGMPGPTTVAGGSCATRRRVRTCVATRRDVMNARGSTFVDSDLESADRINNEMESKAGHVKFAAACESSMFEFSIGNADPCRLPRRRASNAFPGRGTHSGTDFPCPSEPLQPTLRRQGVVFVVIDSHNRINNQ